MQIRLFNVETDFDMLNDWLRKQEVPQEKIDNLPALGYLATDGDKGIAAGFIRMVEGGYAQIDGLTTDPTQPADKRDRAIDMVVDQLVKIAKELKIKGICSFSIDKNTIVRSKKHGFTALTHTVMVLDLTRSW